MSGAAGWLVEAMIASTLLMALVLIARGPVRRVFGPQVAYGLWVLPLLRLLLPPLPSFADVASPIARASGTVTVLIVEPIAAAPAVSLGVIAVSVWLGGAAVFFAWHVARHVRFCRRVVAGAVLLESVGGIRVIASAAAAGPLAFGVRCRFIAVPRDFAARYDAEEQALAMAHELGHHARGDLLANWAALAVLALHWFDPLAWRAFYAFRADQELANDARLLAARPAAVRHVYARAIVKAARAGAVSPACHFGTITNLKGRLQMLGRSPASRRRIASGAGAVAMMIVAGLGLTASGSGAAAISDAVQSSATPPPPPVPMAANLQARTVLVGPDASGQRTLIVRRAGASGGADEPVLPDDFTLPEGCSPDSKAAPQAFVIRGKGEVPKTYTILCTRKGRETASVERNAYEQALESLLTVRRQIAGQVTPAFPEAERRRALAAVDTSITEIEADLAATR